MNENYLGSDFDDFLAEEGLLEEVVVVSINRILNDQASHIDAGKKQSDSEEERLNSDNE